MSNNGDSLDQIKQLIKSNARAIEAITANTQEFQRDRDTLYQAMSRLANARSRFS